MKIGDTLASTTLWQNRKQQTQTTLSASDDSGLTASRSSNTAMPAIDTGSSASASLTGMLWLTQATSDNASASDDLFSELQKLARMTPAEKIRAQYLEQHHMSEDDLKALPADERKAIEAAIAKRIKDALGIHEDGSDQASSSTDSAATTSTI